MSARRTKALPNPATASPSTGATSSSAILSFAAKPSTTALAVPSWSIFCAAGPYPVTVCAAFTVQEEIGLRGAQVAAQRLRPDAAIVLEGTPAYDVPNPNLEVEAGDLPRNPATRLGEGVVLTLVDGRMISDPRVIAFLRETAAADDIPYQVKTVGGGGTDGGAIHTAQTGVPTMTLSTPCRYIHSPTALLNLEDYEHARALSQAVLKRITPGTFQSR